MKSDELFALATAHGIDLQHVAGSASDVHGIARRRPRNKREIELRIEVEPTVRGAGSRVYRRPTWTAAELGQAAIGVPRMPWLAACYSFAGDASGYKELHRGLMLESLKIATREDWPMRVKSRSGGLQYYHAELAALVLDVEAHKDLFVKAPGMFAVCLNVEEPVWGSTMASKYTSLLGEYERWLGQARGMIQRWLRSEPEPHEVEAEAVG